MARRQVARDVFVLGFEAGPIAASAGPGQFVNLLLRPGPLLRRPFSVYRVEGRFSLSARVVNRKGKVVARCSVSTRYAGRYARGGSLG